MRFLFQLLISVLVLTSSGIPQSVVCSANECHTSATAEMQAPEQESHEDACAEDCGLCICCPLRAAPVAWASVPARLAGGSWLPASPDNRIGRLSAREIFQPPRA